MSLTIKKVAAKLAPGRYGDGHGLYLQVGPTGTKSWLFRYEINQRERWMGLGSLATWNLKEARERAREKRQLIDRDIDPLAARTAEKQKALDEASKLTTFELAAKEYYEAMAAEWQNKKYRSQFLNTLRDYAHPIIGHLSVAAIDTGHVRRCLAPIWKTKTVTAARVRGRIEDVLSWAIANKYREGPNPARWADNLEHLLAAPAKVRKLKHHEAMPYAELPEFMATLATRDGVGARALEFLILTAARTGEVTGATWNEIDLIQKVWTVPAARMKVKGGQDHRVPLSDRALALLANLPREANNPFVFIGEKTGRPIGDLVMARKLKTITSNGFVVHGFRSSFSTWAHEATAYPDHIIEMCLAHTVGNAVSRAYQRSDLAEKRRRLMADWARFCSTPAAEGATVVALNRR